EGPDRVVDDEGARHPPARVQRVADDPALEDLEERGAHLALMLPLQPPVLDPHRRLLDEVAHEEDGEGGKDADPQHAAPAQVLVEEAVHRAREEEAETPRSLQDAAHDASRARGPGLHGESGAGWPLRSHADTEEGAEEEKEQEGGREAGDEVAERVP